MSELFDSERFYRNGQPSVSRRTLLKGLGATTLMLLAAACAPAAPSAPPPAATSAPAVAPTAVPTIKKGGTFNWGEVQDPISFDPHTRNNSASTVLRRLIYQSFTRHNPRTLAV